MPCHRRLGPECLLADKLKEAMVANGMEPRERDGQMGVTYLRRRGKMETAAATIVAAMLASCATVRDGLNGHIAHSPQAGADFLIPYYDAALRLVKNADKREPTRLSSRGRLASEK